MMGMTHKHLMIKIFCNLVQMVHLSEIIEKIFYK